MDVTKKKEAESEMKEEEEEVGKKTKESVENKKNNNTERPMDLRYKNSFCDNCALHAHKIYMKH